MIEVEVFNLLKKNKWTVSFAESCTGGMLSSHFTSVSGVSSVFKGAIVSYSNEIKSKHLHIASEFLESKGPFNQETALQMAQGIRLQMNTDWSLATTGIASAIHGREKDTGTVHFAVVGPENFKTTVSETFSGERDDIRYQATSKALLLLKESLLKKMI